MLPTTTKRCVDEGGTSVVIPATTTSSSTLPTTTTTSSSFSSLPTTANPATYYPSSDSDSEIEEVFTDPGSDDEGIDFRDTRNKKRKISRRAMARRKEKRIKLKALEKAKKLEEKERIRREKLVKKNCNGIYIDGCEDADAIDDVKIISSTQSGDIHNTTLVAAAATTTLDSTADDGVWSARTLTLLKKGFVDADSTSEDFWEEVAAFVDRPYIDADMCREKWFEFHGDNNRNNSNHHHHQDSSSILQQKQDAKLKTLKTHALMKPGRDDIFSYTPGKIRAGESKFDDSFGGIDFGSPIVAEVSEVSCSIDSSPDSSPDADRDQLFSNKNSLFLNKNMSNYFEGTFGMRKKIVRKGRGWSERQGPLCIKEEKIDPSGAVAEEGEDGEEKDENEAKPIIMEQKSLGIKTVLSPGGTVSFSCSKEVEDDDEEFDYDSDGNLIEDEGLM
jgi:hypothetical protein